MAIKGKTLLGSLLFAAALVGGGNAQAQLMSNQGWDYSASSSSRTFYAQGQLLKQQQAAAASSSSGAQGALTQYLYENVYNSQSIGNQNVVSTTGGSNINVGVGQGVSSSNLTSNTSGSTSMANTTTSSSTTSASTGQ